MVLSRPPIPHPHIKIRGDPPKLEASTTFAQWKSLMKTHVRSSCIELWNNIEQGLYIGDPDNLTRREAVNSQLNTTALHMIQQGLVKGYGCRLEGVNRRLKLFLEWLNKGGIKLVFTL